MSSQAGPPLLPGPDVDRTAQLASTYIIGCGLSFVFVLLRFWSRLSIHQVGSDDWWMLATWIILAALTIVVSFITFNGGTRHLFYLGQNPADALYVVKLNWISQPFGIAALGTGKISIALLIIRLLDRASKWRKWILYGASVWTLVNGVLMIVFTFFQCRNPRALWTPELMATTKCWHPATQPNFSIYGASAYTLMDFLLAAMPITLVYKLQLDWQKKVGLCLLLGAGSLTGICAAVKTSKLVSLKSRSDITWETFDLFVWTGVEIFLLIVCGSIPTLKPLYKAVAGKRTGWTNNSKVSPNGSRASRVVTHRSSYANNGSPNEYAIESGTPLGTTRTDTDTTRLVTTERGETPMGNIQVTRAFSASWERRTGDYATRM